MCNYLLLGDKVDEVVENSAEEEEQRILDTYDPAPLHESDSDPDDISDVPVISYQVAPDCIEALRLFRLQNPHVNIKKGEQVEDILYREKRDIEGLQGMARRRQRQTSITGFFSPRSDIS